MSGSDDENALAFTKPVESAIAWPEFQLARFSPASLLAPRSHIIDRCTLKQVRASDPKQYYC
jgi:hypothetical protein